MEGAVAEIAHDAVGDALRSVTTYSRDDYEVLYMRADVAEDYTDAEIQKAVEELRLRTFEQVYINDIYQAHHGQLRCEVQWFADAVEMNFLIEDGAGVAVAIDASYYAEQNTLITQLCEQIDTDADLET